MNLFVGRYPDVVPFLHLVDGFTARTDDEAHEALRDEHVDGSERRHVGERSKMSQKCSFLKDSLLPSR